MNNNYFQFVSGILTYYIFIESLIKITNYINYVMLVRTYAVLLHSKLQLHANCKISKYLGYYHTILCSMICFVSSIKMYFTKSVSTIQYSLNFRQILKIELGRQKVWSFSQIIFPVTTQSRTLTIRIQKLIGRIYKSTASFFNFSTFMIAIQQIINFAIRQLGASISICNKFISFFAVLYE